MPRYYVNRFAFNNGDNKVHREGCHLTPLPEYKQEIGEFLNCQGAMAAAKGKNPHAEGCQLCSPSCSKR